MNSLRELVQAQRQKEIQPLIDYFQGQIRILREALLEIAGTSANENSDPDHMADALGEIQGIVRRALEATKPEE